MDSVFYFTGAVVCYFLAAVILAALIALLFWIASTLEFTVRVHLLAGFHRNHNTFSKRARAFGRNFLRILFVTELRFTSGLTARRFGRHFRELHSVRRWE